MENIRRTQINTEEGSNEVGLINMFEKFPIDEGYLKDCDLFDEDYFIADNLIFKLVKRRKYDKSEADEYWALGLCNEFRIEKKYTFKGLEYIDMVIFGKFGERIEGKKIPSKWLSGRDMVNLSEYGFICNAYYQKEVENILNTERYNTPMTLMQFYPGWHRMDNGEFNFYGFKAKDYAGNTFLKLNTEIDKWYCQSKKGWTNECFSKKQNENCHNSKECRKYMKMMFTRDYALKKQAQGLNRLIKDSLGAQIAVSISLSAALFGYLSVHGVSQFNTPIFHFHGASSKGKTTGLKLAASVWGDPEKKENLISSWNKTSTKLIENLNGNNGVPYILNEFGTKACDINFQNLIYCICEGEGKDRMNGENKGVGSWHTAVLSCGENSIISMLGGNVGLYARVFEFFNLDITLSAKHADDIAAFCAGTYGALGYAFVDYIKKNGDDIESRFRRLNEIIGDTIGKSSSVSQRVAKYIAVVVLSTEIADKLGLRFSSLKVGRELVKAHKETVSRIPDAFCIHDKILSYVKRNNSRYTYNEYCVDKNIDGLETDTQLIFIDSAFFDMCKKLEFDTQLTLSQLKANGFLDCPSDRYYKRKNIAGTSYKCYFINKTNMSSINQTGSKEKRKLAGKTKKGGSVRPFQDVCEAK